MEWTKVDVSPPPLNSRISNLRNSFLPYRVKNYWNTLNTCLKYLKVCLSLKAIKEEKLSILVDISFGIFSS